MKEKKRVYTINIKSLMIYKLNKGINIKDLSKLIIIIFKYSAIKIKAKLGPLYSVLNPLTSSDSPSAKSKGVRFVSAKVVVNQTRNKGINIKRILALKPIYM